jgi:hypothetical protein
MNSNKHLKEFRYENESRISLTLLEDSHGLNGALSLKSLKDR